MKSVDTNWRLRVKNLFSNHGLGFDAGSAVLFAAIMAPNLIWFLIPAPVDILRRESLTPTLDAVGSVFQVLMVVLLCFVKNTSAGKQAPYLWSTAACYGLYCIAWVAYYLGITSSVVMLTLCLAPCLAFGFFAVGRKNYPAMLFLAGFTVCHLIFGIVNFL